MSTQTVPVPSDNPSCSNDPIQEAKNHPTSADQIPTTSPAGRSSCLGKSIYVKGDIAAKEDLAINGKINGTISVKNNTLQIGETARIEGTTIAKIVILSGKLKGDIYASQRVIIKKTGHFLGNIYSPDVAIEDGALLKGNIDMEKDSALRQPQPISPQFEAINSKKPLLALFSRNKASQRRNVNPPKAYTPINNDHIIKPVVVNEAIQEATVAAQTNPIGKSDIVNLPISENQLSIIGNHVNIKGDIIAEEDLVILGTIDGNICAKNHAVEVGANAHIKAKIFVKSIIHAGQSNGDIFAREQVNIAQTGHVLGKIFSLRINIESGGVLNGGIDMERENIDKIFSNIKTNINFAEKEESPENSNSSKPLYNSLKNEAKPFVINNNKSKIDNHKQNINIR